MRHLKKYLAVAIAMVVPFVAVASANAAGETVTGTTNLSPRGKTFYKQTTVASNLKIRAEVTTPSSSPFVNPIKNVKVTFPAGMRFNPNNKKTPVCTDSKLSETTNLSVPGNVVGACSKSVIGTGTAAIYIAKVNKPNTLIDDPILVAFNAGKNNKGQPMVKIYGYSKFTNVGILMRGTLAGSTLDIAVPVLSNDSAVKYFELDFPGPKLDRQEISVSTQGRDPNYVQAKCASSPLVTNSVFELGERAYPSGTPTGPTTTVTSPQTTQTCSGAAGKAKLSAKVVKKPRAVKNGRKGAFRIYVKNHGTATAKGVVVTGPGAKRKVGQIAPGKGKTVTVKAKVRGRKGRVARVKFVVKGKGVSARTVAKVRVK